MCTRIYLSPVGPLQIEADGEGVTAIRFGVTDKKESGGPAYEYVEEAVRWLDSYFEGKNPAFTPRLHLVGSTFAMRVWELLRGIEYGKTTTYGAVARELEKKFARRVSAQAVGGAVGRNPVPIIIPCHRVIGSGGALVGFSGGLDKKIALLRHEGIMV